MKSNLLSAALLTGAMAYKPVIMLHGITGSAHNFDGFAEELVSVHPNTTTYSIPMFENADSNVNLNKQVEEIAKNIASVTADPVYADGYHLVCHSQGALICRCLTEYMDDHRIDTFVSLAGPQLGVYDDAFFSFFPDSIAGFTKDEIYHIAYLSLSQSTLSVANMWADPTHYDKYLKDNKFLPKYNGLTDDAAGNAKRKENFLRTKKTVFLVGDLGDTTYDGGIGPWESGAWGYYKTGSETEFITMEESEVYTKDTFGLKSMDDRGDLEVKTVPGIGHNTWVNDSPTRTTYVFPYLT